MFVTIQKWGNSKAIRLPKAILEMVFLKENDRVQIKVVDGNLLLIPTKKRLSLKERIAGYQAAHQGHEWYTGEPTGKEVF